MQDKEIQIVILPTSEKFDESDSRWTNQKNNLIQNLKGEATAVEKKVVPVEGMKGGLETLIVTLGPVVVTSVVEVFKSWIGRDKTKKITIQVEVDGKPVTFTADTTGVGKGMLEEFLTMAIEKAK